MVRRRRWQAEVARPGHRVLPRGRRHPRDRPGGRVPVDRAGHRHRVQRVGHAHRRPHHVPVDARGRVLRR